MLTNLKILKREIQMKKLIIPGMALGAVLSVAAISFVYAEGTIKVAMVTMQQVGTVGRIGHPPRLPLQE